MTAELKLQTDINPPSFYLAKSLRRGLFCSFVDRTYQSHWSGKFHWCQYLLNVTGSSYVGVEVQSVFTVSAVILVYGHCILTEIQSQVWSSIQTISSR